MAGSVETGIEVRPLTGSIGASIRGAQLGELSEAQFAVIHRAFLDRCMLTFPEQHLDGADLTTHGRTYRPSQHTCQSNAFLGQSPADEYPHPAE